MKRLDRIRSGLTVMYVTTVPLYSIQHDAGVALPAVGDEVELDDERYVVRHRVWTVEPPTVAIHLEASGV